MNDRLKAADLLPLVRHLAASEQILLAKLALHAASSDGTEDAERYAAASPTADELGNDDADPLAWEAEGWDEFDATR
ncbi:MAG: hypothetical protein IAG13_19920 [Deltaproteobacteria bacterium]|nr:hypothetical protein [Nannocystaceae bacterium]